MGGLGRAFGVKVLALISRRADLSRDAFRAHYEEVHVPLAVPRLSGLVRYVRYHVTEELVGRPTFDCLTEFCYRDRGAFDDTLTTLASDAGDDIRRDELVFMDKAVNTFFEIDGRVVREAPGGGGGRHASITALVRRPAGVSTGDFVSEYEEQAVPALLGAMREPMDCAQYRTLSLGDGETPFDCITHVHARAVDSIDGWAARLEGQGAGVVVVGVSEHVTPVHGDRRAL